MARDGRPVRPIGERGDIGFTTRHGQLYARCSLRHADGKTRRHEATGTSKAAAKRALLAKLARFEAAGDDTIGPSSLVRDLAALWLERVARRVEATGPGSIAPNTGYLYRRTWSKHLEHRVGGLQLAELSVQRAERVLLDVADEVGSGTAKTARVVLTAIMAMAVKYRAVPFNVVKDAEPISAGPRREPKALSPEQVADLLVKLSMDKQARRRDVPDLVLWMLATSERRGNAIAASWDRIDLGAETADIGPIVVRVVGAGLQVLTADGSKRRQRVIGLPRTAVKMLRLRGLTYGDRGTNPSGLVFPNSAMDGPLDPRNVSRWMRAALDSAGYEWVTPHTFRRTVASTLDVASVSPRAISDRLGHATIDTTLNLYTARRANAPEVTAALEALLTPDTASVTELRPRDTQTG